MVKRESCSTTVLKLSMIYEECVTVTVIQCHIDKCDFTSSFLKLHSQFCGIITMASEPNNPTAALTYTASLKKSFTTSKEYINLYRGHTQPF
jgi:hypothetical protein